MFSGRSFINNKKRIGPNTAPWGTPDVTGTSVEVVLFTTTFWVWLERKDLIHVQILPLTPYQSSLYKSLLLGTVLNAFAKSSEIKSV